MKIARYGYITCDTKSLAQLDIDSLEVSGYNGYVRIDFGGNNHKYRISLKKDEAVDLLKSLYEYLEDELE